MTIECINWGAKEDVRSHGSLETILRRRADAKELQQSISNSESAGSKPEMMTLGAAKTFVYSYLRMNSNPFPRESDKEFEDRIYTTMEKILWEAIGNMEIVVELVNRTFDGWKNGLPYKDTDGCYDLCCYELSLIERVKFIQYFEKIAPVFLTLNKTANLTSVSDEAKGAIIKGKSCNPSTCIDNSEASKELTDKRWGPLRKLKVLIYNYVEMEATKPNCTCLPNHMVDIIYNIENSDGTMLIDSSVLSEPAALDYIKELYVDNKLTRFCKGRPPKNTCPLHCDKK